jgi:ribosome-associated protein
MHRESHRLRPSRAVVDSAGPGEVERAPGPPTEADPNDPVEAAAEASARAVALELAVIADDTRAADVRVLGVSRKVHWARYFVLATAFNRPQMLAVASKVREHLNDNHGMSLAKSVANQGDWVCVDCGDVVAHVFTPSARDFYDIETLYRDAQDVELPFETERPEEDEFEVF